ncbi:PH domain-containing protein [Nocardioides sp.]|uniref:PH domain-containing protein n=1 Tax=Nocardioides sp. TaxID=35761 RepID=UPI00262FA046|nr:PH domain-containing protein [Nocardioides sp.]
MRTDNSPTLRQPTRPVSHLAPRLWRLVALLLAVPVWVLGVLALVLGLRAEAAGWHWGLTVVGVLALLAPLPWLTLIPVLRYRVHRWDVTDLALHVRHGWLIRTDEIVPLSRIQTVDSVQGPLMQHYGLRTVTVKTASSAGHVEIAQLDDPVAREVVAHLVAITAATPEDAT